MEADSLAVGVLGGMAAWYATDWQTHSSVLVVGSSAYQSLKTATRRLGEKSVC
jgi:hypothetical protein